METPRKNRTNARHFDMWGNPVLGHFEMKDYYKNCRHSTEVLYRAVSCMYVVSPTVIISVPLKDPRAVTVEYVYPTGRDTRKFEASDHMIAALRKLFKNNKKIWTVKTTQSAVTFTKRGFLFIPGFQKYGFTLRNCHAHGRNPYNAG